MSNANPQAHKLMQLLHELSKRAEGVGSADISGYRVADVNNATTRMVARAELFRCKLSHKCVRFFNTAAAAEAYGRTHRGRSTSGTATATNKGMRSNAQRAWWPADAPEHYTKATKRTVGQPMPQPTRTNTHSSI